MSDSRSLKLAEARRHWDLGYYREAWIYFVEIEHEYTDLALSIEITGFLLSQGCVKDAHEKISKALSTLTDGAEESTTSMAEVMKATTRSFLTAQFSESLKVITQAYNQHLASLEAEKYTKALVSMELLYYSLNGMASGLGVSVNGPTTDPKKLAKLFERCLSIGYFNQARQIAGICAGPVGPLLNVSGVQIQSSKFGLLKVLLENDSIPGSIRAQSLLDLSELFLEVNDIQQSQSFAKTAKKLFRDAGHACGEDLIELEELKRASSTLSPAKLRKNITAIKERLEKSENWWGVIEAIRALYGVAMESSDYEFVGELDQEIDHIKEKCGPSITWFQWQLVTFKRWGEYQAASLIAEAFSDLGDQKRANEWKGKANSKCTRVDRMTQDSFIDTLKLLNKNSSAEEIKVVDKNLPDALEFLSTEAGETVAISERWVAVMKIATICECYLSQVKYPTRDLQSIKTLIYSCSEKGRSLLINLDNVQAALWKGNFLSIDARISVFEAILPGPMVNVDLLKDSVIQFRKVVDHYRDAGLQLQKAYALMQLATCSKQVWNSSGRLQNSEYFFSAVRYYEEAGSIFTRGGFSTSLRMNTRLLLALWLSGYQAKVELPRGILSWLFPCMRVTSFKKTKNCLESLERLVNYQRHDLSALPMEQALLAKQTLRNNEDVSTIYESGLVLYKLENEPQMVWETLQKSKARSVSDLLGLGVKIPQNLQSRINDSLAAQSLLAGEISLLAQINENKSEGQFQIRRNLEAHRRAMRAETCLQELLDLREGTPVTGARLRSLKEIQEKHGVVRQILFADWFIQNSKVWLTVLTPDGIQLLDLGVRKTEIEEWRKSHIIGKEEPLDDHDPEPLRQLSKLVEPLVNLCNEGDLLVLCPSGLLHYVPIHAATVSRDSEISLIERNPIVYCPSMTVFDQCATRADSRSGKLESTKQTLLAVYESSSNKDGWEYVRDESDALVRQIANKIGNCAVFTGFEVDKSRFKEACETTDIIHFIGHCVAENNALVICGKIVTNNVVEGDRIAGPEEEPLKSLLTPNDTFTASDMLKTRFKNSHFNLMACGSGSQQVLGGDEPWGIVTALLCAGATSVTGTQWDIQIKTAEECFSLMYTDVLGKRMGNGDGRGEGSVVDLAVALQKTVKKLKTKADFRTPFHWTSFVLYGSWFY